MMPEPAVRRVVFLIHLCLWLLCASALPEDAIQMLRLMAKQGVSDPSKGEIQVTIHTWPIDLVFVNYIICVRWNNVLCDSEFLNSYNIWGCLNKRSFKQI